MDAHLRLLLRRYKSTNSPDDAVAFAEATARTDIELVKIWTVIFVHSLDLALSTSVCLTELEALRIAAEWILDLVDDEHINLPANMLIESENLSISEARTLMAEITSQLPRVNISVSVHITSQEI